MNTRVNDPAADVSAGSAQGGEATSRREGSEAASGRGGSEGRYARISRLIATDRCVILDGATGTELIDVGGV